MGKLFVIDGTDGSGKQTQFQKLVERLESEGVNLKVVSFPNYDSPTGKIIGGPYLGKEYISECWFEEGAINVDPKVSSLYYAADRKYNIKQIEELIKKGVNIILDRYVYSNFSHQGGKIKDKDKRFDMYKWLEKLEFDLLELPRADIRIFLHMPYDVSMKLKENRSEKLDEHEKSKEHLIMAEEAYKEIANLYNFKTITCNNGKEPRNIDDINDELYEYVYENLKKC